MNRAEHITTTTTEGHSIEIVDGHLAINGEDKALTPDETDQLLDTLFVWKYGLEAVAIDDLEDRPLDGELGPQVLCQTQFVVEAIRLDEQGGRFHTFE
ncbi:MAG: hypothetical protein E6I80_19270 [Chloroflexi bacterium]|nr:MAG: hypothetical protein E6I80_19270 [Chloroflexota bacterium]